MPNFLNGKSNGEAVKYDRLFWKIQPNPHFEIKSADSDISEQVQFQELGLDLGSMQIGFVKWSGNVPTKLQNLAINGFPNKPNGDGWDTVYSLKVYSMKNLTKPMFMDVTNWGGQRGMNDAFKSFIADCNKSNLSKEQMAEKLPVFLYTGAEPLKNKDGKVISYMPVFKLHKVIENPSRKSNGTQPAANNPQIIDGGVVNDVSEIPQRIEDINKTSSSVNALKNIKQL